MPKYLKTILKKYIKYKALKGKGLNLNYPHRFYNKLGLFGIIDSSYASDPKGSRSVTKYVFFIAGALIL